MNAQHEITEEILHFNEIISLVSEYLEKIEKKEYQKVDSEFVEILKDIRYLFD